MGAVTGALMGIPIVTSRNVPPGQFYIFDRTIFTSMTMDELQIKLWVADLIKAMRSDLADLVAAAERRLGLGDPKEGTE